MTEFKIPEQIEDFRKFYKSKKNISMIEINITTGTNITLGDIKQDFDCVTKVLNPQQKINYKLEYDISLPPDRKIIKVIL